jgi:hypothetical protein
VSVKRERKIIEGFFCEKKFKKYFCKADEELCESLNDEG